MGSFYATCSISQKTIADENETVIQFMVPSKWGQFRVGDTMSEYHELSTEVFLQNIKLKGLEEASKAYDTVLSNNKTKMREHFAPKGLIVSNEGALRNWVPVGPTIRGKYDDCGQIRPSDDAENLKRVALLESIFYGVPFNSIMEAATDDRWFTYGFREGDKHWKVEGLDKSLSDDALHFFKSLSVTYFHQSVYDVVKQFDFCAEEGIMVSEYSKQWKHEYINPVRENLIGILKASNEHRSYDDIDVDDTVEDEKISKMLAKWKRIANIERVALFNQLPESIKDEYFNRLSYIINDTDFEWLFETMSFTYNLSGMCSELTQSLYGSQHTNWKGWNRIELALNPVIENDYSEDEM